jgi:(p)ppGpp synthase/HD superfamily hydrolase
MLADAIAFAADAHRLQKDKNGEVYILHPLRIALALKAADYSETHQTAAVLHDTVEDTEVTLEEIYERFGTLVGEAVDALTRRGSYQPSPMLNDRDWVWGETYKEYIKRCCENLIARVVKRYDVYDNFDPRRYCDGVPIGRYIWTLDYLDHLGVEDQQEVSS